MAAITGIASAALSGVQPRTVHVGLNCVKSTYVVTATLSITDVIEIAKIPDGAVLHSISVTNLGDLFDGKINIGTKADHDAYMQSQTFQARTVYATTGMGEKLDVSDGATNKYTVVQAQISDTTTASGSNAGTLTFLVTYFIDKATST